MDVSILLGQFDVKLTIFLFETDALLQCSTELIAACSEEFCIDALVNGIDETKGRALIVSADVLRILLALM